MCVRTSLKPKGSLRHVKHCEGRLPPPPFSRPRHSSVCLLYHCISASELSSVSLRSSRDRSYSTSLYSQQTRRENGIPFLTQKQGPGTKVSEHLEQVHTGLRPALIHRHTCRADVIDPISQEKPAPHSQAKGAEQPATRGLQLKTPNSGPLSLSPDSSCQEEHGSPCGHAQDPPSDLGTHY